MQPLSFPLWVLHKIFMQSIFIIIGLWFKTWYFSIIKQRWLTYPYSLAYAELYQTISTIFRRFDMELVDTTTDDVKTVHDFFLSAPALDSQGIKIRVLKEYLD